MKFIEKEKNITSVICMYECYYTVVMLYYNYNILFKNMID